MSTKFLSPGWRMPRNANQSKQSNYSMNFDGGSYIDLGNSTQVQPVKEMSISVWINASSLATYKGIVSCMYNGQSYDGFALRLDDTSSNKIQFVVNSTTQIKSTSTIATGQWYHLVVTYDGANIKLYFNGSFESSTSLTGNIDYTDGSRTTNIGSLYSVGANKFEFTGQITEACIFNYALSPSQVTTLYGNSTNGVGNPMALPSAPIAYYPLGESAGGFVGGSGTWLTENNAIGDYVFDFDAGNDRVSIPEFTFSGEFTLSMWINPSTIGSITYIIGRWNGNYDNDIKLFTSNNTPVITFRIGGTAMTFYGYQTSSTIPLNKWSNLSIIRNSSNGINCYLNGVQFGNTTGSSTNTLTLDSIGKITDNATSSGWDGLLSNIQFFNTSLSLTEVETLYNYGSPIKTLANIPQSSNLKAWYKLDASEVYNSTTTEWSVDNNQNPSSYSSSLDFDGVDDYIDCGDTDYLNGVTQMSVSVWFNADIALGGRQGLIGDMPSANYASNNGHFAITAKNNSGNIYSFRIYFIGTDSIQHSINIDNRPFTAGQWHNLVMTYNAGTVNFYVDGSLAPSTIHAGAPIPTSFVTLTNNRPLEIGRWASHVEWDGKISNPSIWNAALTSSQVTELYNNGTPSNLSSHSATSNLVSWWKLNNTTTGIEDAKGSNDGTNYGATEYAGFVNKLVGNSSGMSQANLIQSDLQTVAPYSKYALDFDGTNDYISLPTITLTDNWSVSVWMNQTTTRTRSQAVGSSTGSGFWAYSGDIRSGGGDAGKLLYYNGTSLVALSAERLDDGLWHNWIINYNHSTTTLKCYIDGQENYNDTYNAGTGNTINRISNTFASNYWLGQLSNISIWNTALTSAQVTEIYNQGLPSNLNSHSAYSNLVSWWQLGENSSFDGNDWIVADEKGTNNGTSTGMSVDALTNGVGTTANGVSASMGVGSLVGDAPYSTANALSTNMAVTARVTGSGNTP